MTAHSTLAGEATGLVKAFGATRAVDGVDLAVRRGSVYSVLATASRGLMDGDAAAGDIVIVLATAAALTAVFAPLTTYLYRRG